MEGAFIHRRISKPDKRQVNGDLSRGVMIALAVSQDVQFQFLNTEDHDLTLLVRQGEICSRPLLCDLCAKVSE